MTNRKLQAALDAIRSAALDPRAWPRVQATTEVLLGACASQLAVADHWDGNRFWSRTSVFPEIDRVLPELTARAEPVLWAAARPRWRHFVDYDYIDETGMRRSAFYRQNADYDVTYRLGLRLLDTPGKSTALVWLWPRQAGHVQRPELDLMEAIRQPLRLSALIAERVATDTTREEGVMGRIDAPAFLVQPDGTLVASNGLGEAMLLDRSAVELDGGRLVPRFRPGRDALARVIADAERDPDPSRPRPAHLILPRSGGAGPATFAAMPLARREHFVTGATTLVLLVMLNEAQPRLQVPFDLIGGG